MTSFRAILRVASASPRTKAKESLRPVNKLKGVGRETISDYAKSEEEPKSRKDIRPQDVFFPKPDQVSVLNLAQTGKDMQKAIESQIPRDKGYATVNQLSQFLIETKGGGGTLPV
jgi:predicted transcriptional regulator